MANLSKPLIVVADDDEQLLKAMQYRLDRLGYRVLTVSDKFKLLEQLRAEEPAVLLLDLFFGEHDGVELMQDILGQRPNLVIVLFTAHGSIDSAVTAMKLGAYDYLIKPIDLNRLKAVVDHAIEKRVLSQRVERLEQMVAAQESKRELWGDSPLMTKLRETIVNVARTDVTVLILGESGTGKELVAHSLHDSSPRASGPMIPVNMAALPRELVESTLFGHEKGAFTGADQSQIGCCEAADKGTLFLDEIGEMDMALQAKLLRFLQEHTVQRVGSSRTRTVDVRVIAASNRDLQSRVKTGHFREDLFYRLNVVPLVVPPLRDRRSDIALLAARFLARSSRRYRKPFDRFTDAAVKALVSYDWPGNVRELENLVERLVILGAGPEIDRDALPSEILGIPANEVTPSGIVADARDEGLRPMDQMEKQAIVQALSKAQGNVRDAANLLGLGAATVYRKIKRYGIMLEDRGRSPVEGVREDEAAPPQ